MSFFCSVVTMSGVSLKFLSILVYMVWSSWMSFAWVSISLYVSY